MANQLNTASRWFGTRSIYSYEIQSSACFTGANYLQLTSATNDQFNWTFSTWFKLGALNTTRTFLGGGTSSSNRSGIEFTSANQIRFFNFSNESGGHSQYATTKRKFLDVSNWYHLVVRCYQSGNTDAQRLEMWINGVQVQSNEWESRVGFDASEFTYICKPTVTMHVGSRGYQASGQFDGYLADTHLLTQGRDAESFGQFEGEIWTPTRLNQGNSSGIIPVNSGDGFFLEYKNQGSTGSNSILVGADSSGLGNHLSPLGTWGTGNGGLKDTPTNNFPTLNLQTQDNNENITLSRGNRMATNTGSDMESVPCTWHIIKRNNYPIQGTSGSAAYPQLMAEFYIKSGIGTNYTSTFEIAIGLVDRDHNPETEPGGAWTLGWWNNGYVYFGNSYGQNDNRRFKDGDVVSVAHSMENDRQRGTLWINGTRRWGFTFGVSTSGSGGNEFYQWSVGGRYSWEVITNFGQDSSFGAEVTRQGNGDRNGVGDFYYPYNTGGGWSDHYRNHHALCSKNHQQIEFYDIPIDPRDGKYPKDYFSTKKYVGTGNGNRFISTDVDKPDLVWIKNSTSSRNHIIFDSNRGAQNALEINDDAGEFTASNGLTSFENGGFRVGSGSAVNDNNDTHHSYAWQASGQTTATNTDGTVQSTVSVSDLAKFSIIKYSGTSTTNFTIGHGLGAAPDTFWIKRRSGTALSNEWRIYHKNFGANVTSHFSSQGNVTTSYDGFQSIFPTASVINLKNYAEIGANGEDYICYAWRDVEGFSKFAYYEGGQAKFQYLGFKPALLIIKNKDSSVAPWGMWSNIQSDNAYDKAFNDDFRYYYLHSTNAIGASDDDIQFFSNGFKVLDTGIFNNSSQTYIYWAWAEMPFHYGNAV
jgi:hypothetical protein